MTVMVNKKVLVTGSSGFIGSHIIREFFDLGYEVISVSRTDQSSSFTLDISGDTDWSDVLDDIDDIQSFYFNFEFSDEFLNKL